MLKFSLQKTRWLFISFFLALAIPSSILSYKAHEQLRWQALHQYQQDAQALALQIDASLISAIDKEEARSDTDYTFFVLAGTPEARFVQRSELSKFPVESDLVGVIGYFQIDENGQFSTPVLPSTHVQTAVQPRMYGISQDENKHRLQLESSVRSILSKNKLVMTRNNDPLQAEQIIDTNDAESDKFATAKTPSSTGVIQKDEEIAEELSESDGLLDFDSNQVSQQRQSELEKFKLQEEKSRRKESKQGFSQLAESEIKRKADSKSKLSRKKKNKNDIGASYKSSDSVQNRSQPRKKRLEQNYSPQQSLLAKPESPQRIEQEQIDISLFESEIEPFRFSLLESGHFVVYRQVRRNNKRVIQGAVLSAKRFLRMAVLDLFEQSSLSQIARLDIYYADQLLESFDKQDSRDASRSSTRREFNKLEGEILTMLGLSEPFGFLSLDFRVIDMPTSPGASFIKMVAGSLLLVLILGTYFLYRLVLKQSNLAQQQQDFVSSVSHELKTPLTSIRMYGEILKQGWVSDEKKEEYYEYIYTESERLSRLIANVLQISKVSHNALVLDLKLVEIPELVSLINSKVDSQIEQSEFTLNIAVDEQILKHSLIVDPDAFVQIIINLVDNAIKYSARASNKHIDIRFAQGPKKQIAVSVRDYGLGIEKHQIKRVFDLFYRTGDEMTRKVTGTGIGLALVKELAIAMGAKVEIANKNIGVEFVIIFSSES